MTPLEEIDQAIQDVAVWKVDGFMKLTALGPLYTARAIERLEATVRMIGVQWQGYCDIVVPIMQRVDERSATQSHPEAFAFEAPQDHVIEPHEFYNPIPGRTLCGFCGFERTDKRHISRPK